jgi:alkaline phosphatase D
VNDDFDAAGGGTPVMVDLVSAGISSDSFFATCAMRHNAGRYRHAGVPAGGAGNGAGHALSFNLLDYTMGKAAPTVASLLEQTRVQLRGALAAKGLPEAQLEATVSAVLAGLQANSDFNTSLLALAQQLSGWATTRGSSI